LAHLETCSFKVRVIKIPTFLPGELGLNGLESSFFEGNPAEELRFGTLSELYGFTSKYAFGCIFNLNAPPLVAFLCEAISFCIDKIKMNYTKIHSFLFLICKIAKFQFQFQFNAF
jgi:hypothetical protein